MLISRFQHEHDEYFMSLVNHERNFILLYIIHKLYIIEHFLKKIKNFNPPTEMFK